MKKDFDKGLEVLRNEISECKTYNEKLRKWADLTVDYCDYIARNKIDRCFYAFQSEPPKQEGVEVLILGLNPHGDDNYESMFNPEKEDGWGLNNSREMTTDVFIHQNPWYIGGSQADKKKEWNILNKMNKTTHVHDDLRQLFDNMVYMNILYFNSNNFGEFKTSFPEHWKEVYENNIQLTSLLIFEIIKPKRIICLGIDNCFKRFTGVNKPEELIKGALCKTKKNGIDIYGMTHPSYPGMYNFERENIGWHLYADCFQKPILNSITKKVSEIKSILTEIAEKYNLTLNFNEAQLASRFGCFKFYFPNNNETSIWFEFQESFHGDLRFELHKGKGFINEAKKCHSPFDNWMTLEEKFNQDDFKNYFDDEIKKLLPEFIKISK